MKDFEIFREENLKNITSGTVFYLVNDITLKEGYCIVTRLVKGYSSCYFDCIFVDKEPRLQDLDSFSNYRIYLKDIPKKVIEICYDYFNQKEINSYKLKQALLGKDVIQDMIEIKGLSYNFCGVIVDKKYVRECHYYRELYPKGDDLLYKYKEGYFVKELIDENNKVYDLDNKVFVWEDFKGRPLYEIETADIEKLI